MNFIQKYINLCLIFDNFPPIFRGEGKNFFTPKYTTPPSLDSLFVKPHIYPPLGSREIRNQRFSLLVIAFPSLFLGASRSIWFTDPLQPRLSDQFPRALTLLQRYSRRCIGCHAENARMTAVSELQSHVYQTLSLLREREREREDSTHVSAGNMSRIPEPSWGRICLR